MAGTHEGTLRRIRERLQPLDGSPADHDTLLDLVGDARVVLLGEASHGTHEFYHERSRITQRLITEKGFTTVAVEADWPDAYRVNRFVRGMSDDRSAAARRCARAASPPGRERRRFATSRSESVGNRREPARSA